MGELVTAVRLQALQLREPLLALISRYVGNPDAQSEMRDAIGIYEAELKRLWAKRVAAACNDPAYTAWEKEEANAVRELVEAAEAVSDRGQGHRREDCPGLSSFDCPLCRLRAAIAKVREGGK